jgi:hypothetical protein
MNLLSRSTRLVLAGATATLLAALGTVSAAGAADSTPPTLTAGPYGHYRVGTSVTTSYDPTDGFYWAASYSVSWTASDASGICSQTVTEQSYDTLGGDPDPVLGSNTETSSVSSGARSYPYGTDSYDEARVSSRFVVRATDCAGNTATSRIVNTAFGIKEDTGSGITYQGTWRTSSCSCFSGGTTHHTSAAGASMSVQVRGGRPIGLVMEKAPDRGSASVYVDGALKATVNTYRAIKQHRAIVWQTELSGTALHTLKVVNKATAGHPRIDVDAILL